MSNIRSNANRQLIINGHRHVGFADEDRPIEYPSGEDMADLSYGPDGGQYGTSTVMFGGEVTIRLEPSSPSAQFWMKEKQMWKQAHIDGSAITTYQGSDNDPVFGVSARLVNGLLMRCPDMSEPGVTFEVVLAFERIIGNPDAGKFQPPGAVPAT